MSFSLIRKHASLKRTTRDRTAVVSHPTCWMRSSKKKFKNSMTANTTETQDVPQDDNGIELDAEYNNSEVFEEEIEKGLNTIVDSCLESVEEEE